jgi:hypothetical protein
MRVLHFITLCVLHSIKLHALHFITFHVLRFTTLHALHADPCPVRGVHQGGQRDGVGARVELERLFRGNLEPMLQMSLKIFKS